ncbi:DUF6876 family protein [Mariniflexile sp. HNIBRBA6329]|uniref:DUF6876 family protein n=1 Tax=Mariniflexile sp. HNIBRBA6329 TaxID=3373088 RepID=UPI0037475743
MSNKIITLQETLQQFCGSTQFFEVPLIQTRFTEGIHYLAEKASCFWLITDASVIAKSLMDKSHFITIDFKRLSEAEQQKKGCEAIIFYGDGNDTILEAHRYNVTDFPLDELRLYYVNNTLMLPSEY